MPKMGFRTRDVVDAFNLLLYTHIYMHTHTHIYIYIYITITIFVIIVKYVYLFIYLFSYVPQSLGFVTLDTLWQGAFARRMRSRNANAHSGRSLPWMSVFGVFVSGFRVQGLKTFW